MPETPDFDRIAARLVTLFTYGLITDDARNGMTGEIARELRLVWNARGAADIAKIDAEWREDGLSAAAIDRALRKLDR